MERADKKNCYVLHLKQRNAAVQLNQQLTSFFTNQSGGVNAGKSNKGVQTSKLKENFFGQKIFLGTKSFRTAALGRQKNLKLKNLNFWLKNFLAKKWTKERKRFAKLL